MTAPAPSRRPRGRCPAMVRFLMDYVEGTLPSLARTHFDRHLSDCPGCRAFLSTYRATVRAGRDLRREEIPRDLRDRIVATLRSACRRPRTA